VRLGLNELQLEREQYEKNTNGAKDNIVIVKSTEASWLIVVIYNECQVRVS
jgi:hypothetical protein